MEIAYLKNEILLLKRRINKLGDDLANNEKHLAKLEKQLSDIEKVEKKVPTMYYKDGRTYEIVRYHKYSDSFIEFETENYIYRYTNSSTPTEFPNIVFERVLIFGWNRKIELEKVDCIDHIELLEGVNEYDKTR